MPPPDLRHLTDVDRVIHEPARLLIVALLASVKEADFLYLLRESGLTKGNLSSHLVKLEEARYVEVEKTYRGKVPLTVLRLTPAGRTAFEGYKKRLNGLLKPGR
ncbi:MAG TPA: ArsR family transcriptional regulator [Solibacterales bacterium]|nr:ArsR family transcriptional regulator [Bryobacterales bacterium]